MLELTRGTCVRIAIAACVVTAPVAAQPAPLPPEVTGQIVDEVLSTVVPPDSSLSRVPVAKRGIHFDYARTLAAFGHRDTSQVAVSRLRLRATVKPGTSSLLADCDPEGSQPCRRIGWGALVSITPVSVTDSHALVLAVVSWADRGSAVFQEGVAPAGRAYLVGFAQKVYLVRARDGRWKFEKLGSAIVSE